ncbi:MAG TPA: GNAT family N-acetyltransferase [Candidatus Limnocylindrales bacterium]
MIPELETDRLRLRAFAGADLEPFAELNADPEVMEHFPARLTRQESDAFAGRIARRWTEDGHGLWAVERLADGAFLGFTGIARLAWLPLPEVGWRFARFAWGHGYATEAAREALRWGFEEGDFAEIVSVTTIANERSQAVMRRLGMTRDPADDFLHPNLPDGHPLRPHVLYRLSRDGWEELMEQEPLVRQQG